MEPAAFVAGFDETASGAVPAASRGVSPVGAGSIHGCTNRGYKSARIIDEAVLGTIMATLFTDAFINDLTAEVNKRLAWIARQPIPSTKKLEQEIANEDRQLKRLADRRPGVKRVKEKDVVVALGNRRDLLQGDVGVPPW